jgi:hypothetical protein
MKKTQIDVEFIDPTDKLIAVAQMLDVGAGRPDNFDESGMIGAGKIILSTVNEIHVICENLNEKINAKPDDPFLEDDELMALLREAMQRGFDVVELLRDGLKEGNHEC